MPDRDVRTRRLLVAGVGAGPLFVLVWALQAFTRAGFRPGYHPLSLLSLGDLGYVQIANFVVCGLLYLLCAAGLRRSWQRSGGGRWAPRLLAMCGVGLIIAGVFVTDAGAGFPPGTPDGPPDRISWHGVLHEIGFAVFTVAWLGFCGVLIRRRRAARDTRWTLAGVLVLAAVLILAGWPDLATLGPRLTAVAAVQLAFVAAVAAAARRDIGRPRNHRPAGAQSDPAWSGSTGPANR